ncbi:MAG: chemotaxis protein methyltransferase CheR [Candidatus Omnitrophota bacterium]|jgi:chemotaxis protein methyltransferase CheR
MINISESEYLQVKDLMYAKSGVYLKSTKKSLIVSRLSKRIKQLNLSKLSEYISLLSNPKDNELETFVNAITTNETFFFRHTKQFNYLYENILPDLINADIETLRIWSAACSTGEEPYSLAIALIEYFKNQPKFKYEILASDINTLILEQAKVGLYREDKMGSTTDSLRAKYFTKIPNEKKTGYNYQIAQRIKNYITFFQHNLMNVHKTESMDIIFLRNVLFYFDETSTQKCIQAIRAALKLGGYLFIGLSENIHGHTNGFKFVSSGIYQKC